jgi:hypothetical protein
LIRPPCRASALAVARGKSKSVEPPSAAPSRAPSGPPGGRVRRGSGASNARTPEWTWSCLVTGSHLLSALPGCASREAREQAPARSIVELKFATWPPAFRVGPYERRRQARAKAPQSKRKVVTRRGRAGPMADAAQARRGRVGGDGFLLTTTDSRRSLRTFPRQRHHRFADTRRLPA